MSRYDLVKKYNYYTRKRESYKEKLTINSELKSKIENSMDACMKYSQDIGEYDLFANLFNQLYDENKERYSESKKQNILDLLNALDVHINNKISNAQDEINYWDGRIKKYDEEERQKQEEAVNEGK